MKASQSQLSEWEKCPRRHAYRYVMELEPKRLSIRAEIGKAVHSALRMIYMGSSGAQCLDSFNTTLIPLQESGGRGELDLEELEHERKVWAEILEGYLSRYKEEDFEVLAAPEQEVAVAVANGRHEVMAVIDLIIKKKDGTIWVMDHKTTTRTGPSWWTQFFVDKQGSLYTMVAERALGVKVEGWIINAMKPVKRIEERYERQAFFRTREQMISFERQLEAELDRIEAATIAAKQAGLTKETMEETRERELLDRAFPQYTHECHGFGTCQFLSLCHVGKAGLPLFKERERS